MTTPFVDSTIKFHALELLRSLRAKEDYLFECSSQLAIVERDSDEESDEARRVRLAYLDAAHATLNLKQVLIDMKIISEL